ncbi:hypothetical protein EG68_09530 [Paragonimus skrjabini miyazakii]|uniref:poly(ADP-ribose) glycohydrolase n=1 Tax=Paragonimus skrjabini miyazakii TaxID=59628 RepID=A0A8S9YLP1_9TREM|nr:hypothetical protein EG68_09530 [Paragonimus skrjabini miyazakii]
MLRPSSIWNPIYLFPLVRRMADSRKPTGSCTLRQTSLEEGFSGCNSLFSLVIRISVCTRKRERLSSQTTSDYSDSPPKVSEVPSVDVNELSPPGNREVSTNSFFTACPLNQLGESLDSLKNPINHLPPLRWSQVHKIFFDCSAVSSIPLVPFPERYVDKWSEYFVRLPCSPESLYPVTENGKKSLIARWNLIEKCLRQRISTPSELQEAVLSYNSRFRTTWNFNVFHNLCANKLLPDGDEEHFFRQILPVLSSLALNLPVYLTQASFSQLHSYGCSVPIPLIRSGCARSFTFSQLQIASLLANAFFCTFPRRNSLGRTAEFANFPAINFSSLLSVPHRHPSSDSSISVLSRKREKVRCLLHYFHRITQTIPAGVVTYTRRHLGAQAPNWAESVCSFDQLRIHISSTGTIEEAGSDTLQVDFANRYLGGGVLNSGCVQEEIMFVLRPELLAACLFMERLDDDETVIVEGVEQYSISRGYADNFRWAGDYRESQSGNQRYVCLFWQTFFSSTTAYITQHVACFLFARNDDKWGRWRTTVVAMDALYFGSSETQYLPKSILRELNKAYCGFTDTLEPNRPLPSVVATGNWGCGAFRGNTDLKALIQMMACVQAGKALAYYSFGDQDLCTRLYDIYTFLASNKITVGNLWNVLATLGNTVHAHPTGLYDYIKQKLT